VIPSREHLLAIFRAAESRDASRAKALSRWLYSNCYTVRFPNAWPSDGDAPRSIIDELSAANSSRDGWDLGWKAEFIAFDGRVLATKCEARRWFVPGQFITVNGPDRPPRAGEAIHVFSPKESRVLQESFYFAFGETVSPLDPSEESVRVYWNITIDGASRLISAITAQFNRFQTPFRLKSVHRPADFWRLDAAVLYVHKTYWTVTAMLLERVHREIAEWMRPETPLFTKPLAPGLAVADDPPGSMSFGHSRCDIVAGVLAAIRSKALDSDNQRMEEYRSQFLTRELDPERPYLNPGCDDVYDVFS
jgi:hypothetical protein